MGWVSDYQETLRDLGVEEDQLHFPADRDRGTARLTEKYISRVEFTLATWFQNILEVPLLSPPTREVPIPETLGCAVDKTSQRHCALYRLT